MVTTNALRTTLGLARLVAAAAILLGASVARAADEPPAPDDAGDKASPAPSAEPRAHHDPIATAKAHEDLRIQVAFDHGEAIRSAGVVFRSAKGELRLVPLLRHEGEGYAAIIPGAEVVAPGIAYAIEIERLDGRRVPVFASRADLQPVQVMEDRTDVRERALLKRLDGRRSVVTASGEYVRFGATGKVDDQYWRTEGGYTYRPLRFVEEFSLKIGVVRGTSPVSTLDESKNKVGLNYASPSVRFRFHDAWHLDLELVTSITEIGFSVGGGGALLIGDPYGTRITLGGQAVGMSKATYFGSRFYARLDLLVHSRVVIAPTIEVTDMPHADTFGVRLYGDVNVHLGRGFSLGARGGYQARLSTSGGVGLGGTAAFAF